MLPKLMKNDFQQLSSQTTPLPYSVLSVIDLLDSLRQPTLQSVEITNEPISTWVSLGRTRLENWYSREHVAEQALVFTELDLAYVKERHE